MSLIQVLKLFLGILLILLNNISYQTPETIDVLSEGKWQIDVALPLLPVHLERVEFTVRAELDDDGVTHTAGRNYDIGLWDNNGTYAGISFYAPYDGRPNGYFRAWATELCDPYDVEPSEVERILNDIHKLEGIGLLYKEVGQEK